MARFLESTTLILLSFAGITANSTAQKPNFLFILVDDLGWMDIGANNPKTFYETPNVDRIAATGMRFTQAYAACPVCSPTRASILTGKYPARINTTDYFGAPQPDRVRGNRRLLPARYVDHLPLAEITLAEALHAAGYATFFAGKWHLGGEGFYPEDQGFDVNRGGIARGGPYGGKRYFSPYGNPRLKDGPDGEHLPARLGRETVEFIHRNRDKPFLAYLSFYSVHTPLMTREDLVKKYRRKAEAQAIDHDGPKFLPEGRRKARQYQDHAVYAGMVEAMDQAVGEVLAALVEDKLTEHTIVIFMSDNGGLSTSEGSPTSNVPLRAGKGWMYEGGIREPMIVRWPGVTRAGSTCSAPVISTDFYPTILDMAGLPAKPEQHVDGVSLTPLLKDADAKLAREALFWHYPHYGNQGGSPTGAVRAGDYKLIEFYEDDHVELYNLANDIGEHRDLAAEMPKRAATLRKLLADWRERVYARMPTPNSKYKPRRHKPRKRK